MYAMARYTDPTADYNYFLAKAKAALTQNVLNASAADKRGWCKYASTLEDPNAHALAVDVNDGTVASLITHADFGCTKHKPLPMPDAKATPQPEPMFNPLKARDEQLGPAAGIQDMVLSYLPQGMALDPNNPLSPIYVDHPLNPRNPANLAFNPVPAMLAYRHEQNFIQMLANPNTYGKSGAADGTPQRYRETRLPK